MPNADDRKLIPHEFKLLTYFTDTVMFGQESAAETRTVQRCREMGLTITPFGPYGRLGLRCVRLWFVAMTVSFAAWASVACAQDPAYLNEMPSVDRVKADMRTRTARETAVRTSETLSHLATVIKVLSASSQKTPLPIEATRIADYERSAREILRVEQVKVDQLCGPRPRQACGGQDPLAGCESAWRYEPAAYREFLDRYFSPQWQSRYAGLLASGGGVWRQGLALPAGTKAKIAEPACADGRPVLQASAAAAEAKRPINWTAIFTAIAVFLMGSLEILVIGGLVAIWLGRSFYYSRGKVVRRGNAEALAAFGAHDSQARERAIIEAFDSSDYTFRFNGVNRATGHKMRFVLLRSIRAFKRAELEALRFAYLAFNRTLLNDEMFHRYRFGAIYGAGRTDLAESKRFGMFGRSKSGADDIAQSRASLTNYAQANDLPNLEAATLAAVQQLALQHPSDELCQDIQRRLLEGTHWLSKGDIKNSTFAPAADPYYVQFGVLDGSDAQLTYSGDGSIITIAPPGAGKTSCNVLPNLLRWPGPALVLDVKGEIHAKTAQWRAANVGPVVKFSPLDPATSACYNPLTVVRRESLYVWEDARLVAEMMTVPNPKTDNPFWENSARNLLTAIIADLAFWNPPEQRPMSKVLSILSRNGWQEFVDRLRKNPEVGDMQDAGAALASQSVDDPKTLDGVLQFAKAGLGIWSGQRIAQVTKQSDWSPSDLRSGRNLTIYICVNPNDVETYASLLRVFIAQHIRALTEENPRPEDAPVLFVLDELPRLRYMPPIEAALDTGRGYKIRLWMFAQNLGQLRTAYPNADGMIGSCAVSTYMNPSAHDGTAEKLAEQIGAQGIAATADGGSIVSAIELAGPRYKDLQIVLGVNSKPAKVRKMPAHKDAELVARMATP